MSKRPRPAPKGTIRVETERDLRRHMRAISRRLNDNPDIARLVFVNPILALQDIDVELTAEVKRHVMDALRFPPLLRERKAELEKELPAELRELGIRARLPLSPAERGHLLFEVLELEPLPGDARMRRRLPPGRAARYADQHPLVAKLAEYEQVRQGSLLFQSKANYRAFKRGEKQYAWIDRVTFDV